MRKVADGWWRYESRVAKAFVDVQECRGGEFRWREGRIVDDGGFYPNGSAWRIFKTRKAAAKDARSLLDVLRRRAPRLAAPSDYRADSVSHKDLP